MPAAPLRINLIMPTAWVYGADIARGVLDEAAHVSRWNLHLMRDGLQNRVVLRQWLSENPAHGAIVLPRFKGCSRLVAKSCPLTVTVCDDDRHQLMRVGIDDEAVGYAAGDHFRERGLKNFAYIRNSEGWSSTRERGFRRGCVGPVSILPHSTNITDQERWLQGLPKPVGLFAGNDLSAVQMIDTCTRLNLNVPHDLALLGADDDQLVCLSVRPALSSVRIPWREVGREAARALGMLLAGRKPQHLRIPPLGISIRPSTDLLCVTDTLVIRALAFIRAEVSSGINVEDVVRNLGCSRSQLERRMRTIIGYGPLAVIRRFRVELATRRMSSSSEPLSSIWSSSGFPSSSAMHAAFHQLVRMSPHAYHSMSRVGHE